VARTSRRGLQIEARAPNSHPDDLSVAVPALKHEIGRLRGLGFSVGAVLLEQQVRGTPYVDISNHRRNIRRLKLIVL
jgi:hypothetical protein